MGTMRLTGDQDMTHTLLIKGGTLIDPAQKIYAEKDVAFDSAGVVAAVDDDLLASDAREVLDAGGRIVTPGMVDLHVHVFHDISHYGIEPDPTCLATGATTVVDAGSAGADTFSGFRRFVIELSQTRIFAFLNISSQGMLTADIGEFEIPEYANVDSACATVEQHRDLILGIKVRLTRETIVSERAGMLPLHRAREAADAIGLPLMVHPQDAWCEAIDDVLAHLREGDVLTHCFHGKGGGILDERGRVRSAVCRALARGVVLDVGHGAGSFSWEVAERAIAQGVEPDIISSDLHTYNLGGPVYDLATTVTKFLHLGLPLGDAIAKVTAIPAQTFPLLNKLGTLSLGAPGDAVVFELRDGEFSLVDAHGQVRVANQKLVPVTVVRRGRRVA